MGVFLSCRYITTFLKWDDHINKLCSRAKKLIGYLYRVLYRNVQPSFLCHLFTSVIRPILEYACQMWDPYTVKNRQKIENVQKYALRICSGRWLASYEELLDEFKLSTLASRQEYLRIISLHQYHTQHSYFPLLKSLLHAQYSFRVPFCPGHSNCGTTYLLIF